MRRRCFPRKCWTSCCCSSKLLPLYTDVNLILLLGVSVLLLVVMGALLPIVLPVLLIAGLLAALALIPILRQLRSELEQLDQVQQKSSGRIPMDVTPWQQKLWDRCKASLKRRS